MKKYLLGACAIVLAIGFSAFGVKDFATKTFRYVPPSGSYATADVENPQNWVLGSNGTACNNNNKACDVDIDDTKVQNANAATLALADPNIVITAEQGSLEAALQNVEVGSTIVQIGIRNRP